MSSHILDLVKGIYDRLRFGDQSAFQIRPQDRPLWWRCAETPEGNATLAEARNLSMQVQYSSLSDAELLRLAYWGATGPEENRTDPSIGVGT